MIIKVFNLILTHDNNQTIILSNDNSNIILPMFTLKNPKYIREEIRYLTKNLFKDKEIIHPELINISFMEIQNQLLINYISDIEIYKYRPDEDLCIYSSVILSKKASSDLYWVPLKKKEDSIVDNIETIDLLIDYTIKNTVL